MLGIPREYLNVRRPGSIVHWYRSMYATKGKRLHELAHVFPVVAQVEPTVCCDLSCTFCHSKDIRRSRPKQHMSYEEFRHILDQLNFLVVLGIVGMGEPTRNSDFFRMVRLAVQKGIATHTVTNCNLHTQEIAEQLICTGLRRVAVSIDGATAETHERGRLGASFTRILTNLERLVRLRKSGRIPRIAVQMLALEYNYREIPAMTHLCLKMGVDELTIQGRPTDWGKNSYVDQTVKRAGTTAGEDYEKAINEAKTIARGSRLIFEDHRSYYNIDDPCRKPWRDIYVATTGEVVPCCTIADPKVMCMGNLFEQSFNDIWNGPKYIAFRKSIRGGHIPRCCFQCYSPDLLLKRNLRQDACNGSQL